MTTALRAIFGVLLTLILTTTVYARNYDPSSGRYVESDPLGLQGGVSTYSYTMSNPLKFIDPFGLKVEVRCRQIAGPQTAKWYERIAQMAGAEHCFVYVDCPMFNLHEAISYLGHEAVAITGQDWNNDIMYSGMGKYRNLPVFPPPDSSSNDCQGGLCKFERCLDLNGRLLQATGYTLGAQYSALWGPNSNSVARRLIEMCGGRVAGPGPMTGWQGAGNVGF